MTTVTVTYTEREEFDMAHNAPHAWGALANLHTLVRNQLKHGDEAKDREVLATIKSILDDVRWRVE